MLLTEHATRFYEEKIRNRRSIMHAFSTIEELPKRVLVAEPEPDIQQIYSIWLNSMAFKEVVSTDSGKKCLDEILKIADITKNENNTKVFDLIILDTHIKDIPCIQVAKEIFSRKPDQRIISQLLILLGKTFIQLESR